MAISLGIYPIFRQTHILHGVLLVMFIGGSPFNGNVHRSVTADLPHEMVDSNRWDWDLYLVGGDWNHGIWLDFPETVGSINIIPTVTHSIIFQRGGSNTNQFTESSFFWDFHSGMDDHKPTKTMKRLTRSAHIRWFRGDMIHHSKGIQYDRMGDITNLIQYLGIW